MKIFITGAAGFIGSQLVRRCLDDGHEVVGVDCLTPYYDVALKRANVEALGAHQWRFIEGDLLTLDLEALIADVDVVFHLAAQPGVRASWGDTFHDYVDSNVIAMQRLLEATRAANLSRFVFASSSSVYGDAETLPTREDTPLQPVSPYGATKALGEHLCRVYRNSYDLPYVILRYFTVYGPGQRPDMAFNKLIAATLEGREIQIYGDGDQTRDFTFVADAVSGTLAAGLRGRPGVVYNLGGGDRTSLNEVLAMIAELTGETPRVCHTRVQEGDVRDTAADTSAARADLAYAPSRSLYEGLREQVAWQRGLSIRVAAAAGSAASPPS